MTHSADISNDRVLLGIGLISISVLAMAFSDAMVKFISSGLTLWQIFVLRALLALPWLFALLRLQTSDIRLQSLFWIGLRSLLLVGCWVAYYTALPVMDLAVAAVVVYTNPILTTLLAALFLNERVSVRQWLGVFLGFCGVLVILQPGGDAFSASLLLPLLAALLYSLAMILTRSKCRTENAVTLALGLNTTFILVGGLAMVVLSLGMFAPEMRSSQPFLLGQWATPALTEWLLLALLGALSAGYFLGVARAYQVAPPQVVATFDYGYLVSAAIWGLVIFGETLAFATIVGMVLITAAGLLASKRA
jgi:drug/metabolite transporter (DMT)-like permease